MTFVKPTISADAARRRIERRWWHRFRGNNGVAARGAAARHPPALPRLELVCLPYYLIAVETLLGGKRRDVTTTVEAYAGTFALFDDSLPCEPAADRRCLPPRIDRAEAVKIARNGLQCALLRSRGGQRKPVVGQLRSVELLGYHYWVYYYERRKQRLDIKVLDAVTGGPPGPKIKTSLLAAFVAARTA